MCRADLVLRLWPLAMLTVLCFMLATFSLQASESIEQHSTSSSLPSMYKAQEAQKNIDMNYGVIIDAGSSGSRVYVYVWPPHSGNPKDLMRIRPLLDSGNKPVMKKVSPGLSTMAKSPHNASVYMRPLLEYAEQHIPANKHAQSLLFIMATAGLRLLSESEREPILNDLRANLPGVSRLLLQPEHIEMIPGKWEGIYSWVAVNYALGKFYHKSQEVDGINSVGMIDIGGGSLQIAFEIKNKLTKVHDHLWQRISLGCTEHDTQHDYMVYVTTFLGMGANSASKRYEELLYDRSKHSALSNSSGPNVNSVIYDECLPYEYTENLTMDGSKVALRKGTGQWNQCVNKLKPLLNQQTCVDDPCSMNGVHQPELPDSDMPFYGFSECWYSTEDILSIGGAYDRQKLGLAAKEFCSTEWSKTQQRVAKGLYPKADADRLRTQCFKSALLASVLHQGFHFPQDWDDFTTVKDLDGQEVQWTLGALLYKMRYFPLRDVEKVTRISYQSPSNWLGLGRWSQVILLLCFIIVLYALFRYFFIIRRLPRKYKNVKMRRSQSMWGYMMLNAQESDSPMQGVRIENSQYVY